MKKRMMRTSSLPVYDGNSSPQQKVHGNTIETRSRHHWVAGDDARTAEPRYRVKYTDIERNEKQDVQLRSYMHLDFCCKISSYATDNKYN